MLGSGNSKGDGPKRENAEGGRPKKAWVPREQRKDAAVAASLQSEVDRLNSLVDNKKQQEEEDRNIQKAEKESRIKASHDDIVRRVKKLNVAFGSRQSYGLKLIIFIFCLCLALTIYNDVFVYSFVTVPFLCLNFLCSSKKRYRYYYVGDLESPRSDARADYLTTGKLKHEDPLLAWVEFKDYGLDLFFFWKCTERRKLTVSLELLSQILIAANLSMTASDELVAEKLQYQAARVDSVNIDRSWAVQGHHIVQDTVFVAYALHKQRLEERMACPFPRTLAA
jgi:hypothetical protein